MVIYSAFFVVLLILGLLSGDFSNAKETIKNKRKLICILLGFLFILLFGLRSIDVGIDTKSYQHDFNIIEEEIAFRDSELGFYYFTYFIKKIGIPWQIYLAINAAIMFVSLLLLLSKNSKSIVLSMFLFVTIGNFTMYLSGLRQSLAISFTILAYVVLENTSWKGILKVTVSLLFWIISIQFHLSAIVFFGYYILKILKIRLNRMLVIFFIVVAVLSIFYGRYLIKIAVFLLPEKYSHHDLNEGYNINPLLICVSIAIPIFCVMFINPSEKGMYDFKTTNLFVFSIVSLFLLCMSTYNNQIGRIAYYFNFANILLIPLALSKVNKADRILFTTFIIIFSLIYFYKGSIGGTLQIDNYRFFWQERNA